jgi:hypothetical protein
VFFLWRVVPEDATLRQLWNALVRDSDVSDLRLLAKIGGHGDGHEGELLFEGASEEAERLEARGSGCLP